MVLRPTMTTPQQVLPAKLGAPKLDGLSWVVPAITSAITCGSGAAIVGNDLAGPVVALIAGLAGAAFGFWSRRVDEKKK